MTICTCGGDLLLNTLIQHFFPHIYITPDIGMADKTEVYISIFHRVAMVVMHFWVDH